MQTVELELSSLSPLLSSTTGPVDLSLSIDTMLCSPPGASLLTHLQGMPFLHRVDLELPSLRYYLVLSTKQEGIVSLSHLMYFHFRGQRAQFEALMAWLDAPSLQDLSIKLQLDGSAISTPHLSSFVISVGADFCGRTRLGNC